MQIGADLVVKTVEGIGAGNLTPKPQEELINNTDTIHDAPKLTKELCRIDWNKTSIETDRLIRGLSPYPAAFSTISDGTKNTDIKIFEASPAVVANTELQNCKPGDILTDQKSYIYVVCKYGAISLDEIQLAGKKRMKTKDFLLGFRDIGKYRFL